MSEVGNPVLWVATRKILIHIKEQEYFRRSLRDDLFLQLPISIAWCDVTQVYSFKAIGIHSYACYLGGCLCDSAVA